MIWHILRKDLRLLRWPTALVVLLLAPLAQLDAWRYDYEAGLAETVLNILVPLAWSLLIALAVQQEPLISDTAFWLSKPYRRGALLASKVLFAVIAVHAPLLLAHAVILAVHGFSPFASALLWKQAQVFLAVTIPSLAIASVTSSLASFSWCALAVGAVAFVADSALIGRRNPYGPTDWIPLALVAGLVALGGLVLIAMQYARRTRWVARSIGCAIAAAAVVLYTFVPRDLTARMQCAVEADSRRQLAVTFAPTGSYKLPVRWSIPGRVPVFIPVHVTGMDGSEIVAADQLSVRVSRPGSPSWEERRDLRTIRNAFLSFDWEQNRTWQVLLLDNTQLDARGPAKIDGTATIRSSRKGETKVLGSTFGQTDIPGFGRCSASVGNPIYTGAGRMLKVICEAPGQLPGFAHVVLVDSQTGREWKWKHRLGDSYNVRPIPAMDWLSPLQRRQTFFHIVENESNRAGDRWLVPASVVPRSQIRIEPSVADGCANVAYSLEVPDLRPWVPPAAPR
jgi:hypothetical protein